MVTEKAKTLRGIKTESKSRGRMKSYNKNLRRMFGANILRLLAISMIIAIGICVATGISGTAIQIRDVLKTATLTPDTYFFLSEVADKVELIANILPVFFIAISVLTALTTVTRLIDEERPVFACYKTLGYSNAAIIGRYLVFAFACAAIGCTVGLLFGNFVIRPLIYNVIKVKFDVPAVSGIYFGQGLIWSVVMSAVVILSALLISGLRCREKPAELLRPKAPKAGKKTFLEFIPFIWRRLKFKFKSSVRNIVRFKGRLFMTVFSVAGATIMLFVGLGLISSVNSEQNQTMQGIAAFIDSMNAIAVIITLCGISLSVLVLFNLTNINIEERRREIATLKVLGYKKFEVAGYIYRELMTLSVIGILLGLPCGYYFSGFLFEYLDFGSLDVIKWYTWLGVTAIALFSVILADILLFRKISKIEMTASLKVIE